MVAAIRDEFAKFRRRRICQLPKDASLAPLLTRLTQHCLRDINFRVGAASVEVYR